MAAEKLNGKVKGGTLYLGTRRLPNETVII
jgi:hypothetical protein